MKKTPNVKEKLGYRNEIVSVGVNLLLFILKYYAGVVSASVTLIADAWHTLSEILTSIVAIFGIKASSGKSGQVYSFGYDRWKQISEFAIAILLIIVGLEFMQDAIFKLQTRESAGFGWLAYTVIVVSIVLKETLARYAFYVARKTGHTAVKVAGWRYRIDTLFSVVILAGVFLNPYFWWIDGVLGIMASVLLLLFSYGILRETVTKILGEEPTPEVICKVNDIVRDVLGDKACPHHYYIHNYGDHVEFTFYIKVPGDETVLMAHSKATVVECRIKEEMDMGVTIHIEPLIL